MKTLKNALVSTFHKEGLAEFCQGLQQLGITIFASEGTGEFLKSAQIVVRPLSQVTGFGELLGGRVKTLHPAVFAAILARRDQPEDERQLASLGIAPFDLVAVNLYPFGEKTVEEPMELVDIGGSALLRAAAKNYKEVTVLVDPQDYPLVLGELKEKGGISFETRHRLAGKAFSHAAAYDARIAASFYQAEEGAAFPAQYYPVFQKMADLRYGENPHQQACLYAALGQERVGVPAAIQLQGKTLSYNNILDLDAALVTVSEFEEPAAVIIKHNNPCGVAISKAKVVEAYRKARKCDPVSAFGGVIALNRPLDDICAEEIASTFMEAIMAPGYDKEAMAVLKKKKNFRVLEMPPGAWQLRSPAIRGITGGLLLQDMNALALDEKRLKVVTRRTPTEEEMEALKFAWKVCKHVKSNAIVYALKDRTVGIGAGQMSRVDAALVGVMKAKEGTQGSVVASDAFFPFRDGVDTVAQAGVTAIIQPGGSVKDQEVIAAADEHGLAMVFTGIRHFKH